METTSRWRGSLLAGALAGAAALAVGVGAPAGARAQTIDDIVAQDLGTLASGAVVAVFHEGELAFMRAWGHPADGAADSLGVGQVFPFPALAPFLVATTARVLDAGGILDLDAPVSTMLPDLPAPLGRVTLAQLLTHTAGLDDAAPPGGRTIEEAVAELPASAMVAEPGFAYSWSRWSYPLAVRAVEAVVGVSMESAIRQVLFRPLGMTVSTFHRGEASSAGLATGYVHDPSRDVGETPGRAEAPTPVDSTGLPVLYTTAPELLQLAVAWMGDGIAGAGVDALPGPPPLPPGHDGYLDGWTRSQRTLLTRYSVSFAWGGFSGTLRVFPETSTVLVVWANVQAAPDAGRAASALPFRMAAFSEERLLGQEIPTTVTGSPTREPAAEPAGSSLPPWAWAGTYRNGDLILVLRAPQTPGVEAELAFFDGTLDLPLEPTGEAGLYQAVMPDGRDAFTLRVLRDPAGRRFVFFDQKVWREWEQEGGGGG